MSSKYLLLWLESPLQSWGADSQFSRRETCDFPTKSGVLGLLCCALGLGGEQREWLSEMATLSQDVISFVRSKKTDNPTNTTNNNEPLLRDFHMVGSGYDDQDPWQTLLIPKTGDGKKAVGGGAKLTYRHYLQDSYFAVIVETPDALTESIIEALQNPVWDLYLGRKSCVPTDFIYRGVYSCKTEALNNAIGIATDKNLEHNFQVNDGENDGEVLVLNDVPVQFGKTKIYRDRYVTVIREMAI